jgi:hypothetical protein
LQQLITTGALRKAFHPQAKAGERDAHRVPALHAS